jgi:hypothetical protein
MRCGTEDGEKSDDAFRIICVTRLVTVKGLETVVKAVGLTQPKRQALIDDSKLRRRHLMLGSLSVNMIGLL